MALKTKVKAGNITNLSDARYCSGMGVDFIGFPVHDATQEADIKRFNDVRGWIAGPATVLEWNGAVISPSFLANLSQYNAGFLEINVSVLESLSAIEVPIMVNLNLEEWPLFENVLMQNRERIHFLILESAAPALLKTGLIREIGSQFDVLLKLGHDDSDLNEILALNIKGIVLSGSEEDKPGLKEYVSLSDVLEQLEEE